MKKGIILKMLNDDDVTSGLERARERDYIMPSLYVDFDNKFFYSMYIETISFEDYVPKGWKAKYGNFHNLIPNERCYWWIDE